MQAEEALGPPAGLGEALDRQRRGGAGEDRLGAEDPVQLGEQPGLDLVILDDRLDDEARGGEGARVGHDLDVLTTACGGGALDLGSEAGERPLDGRPCTVG